ncbi:hypothetical protein FQU76_14705 [Streptomyces qinzhouensis]|uniref:DUF461 domain-containing protein n=1 Tax=Streptomyces qinzhouensis TaxID=2599401 RepID=A0A5B8JT36_9ACTN|nr:hypothetical protein FQU76_14705 [Streptomyces qinzhouensis]
MSFAALTACGAGNNAQSLGIKPDTATASVDNIAIQNANVITQSKADQAGPAVVSATIFNKGETEQTLDSITLPGGAGTVKLTAASGSGGVTVPAQGSIVIGGKGNASAVIEDGTALTKKIGGVQDVVFRLSKTGDVKLEAFVVPDSADGYQDFGPGSAPAPAAAPSGTPAGQPGAEGTEATDKPEGTDQTADKADKADKPEGSETPAG